MSDIYYPPIDAVTMRNLGIIKQLMQEHPAFFLGDHPYSGAMETMLKSWFSSAAMAQKARDDQRAVDEANSGDGPSMEEDRDGYLYRETLELYKNLKAAKYGSDDGDSMSYYRTMANLQEKLIDFQKDALLIKQAAENNKLILKIMEEVLTQEQREKFLDELKSKLDPKNSL